MAYQATTALRKIAALKKRIRIIQGGTSASKTISILLFLINAAQSDKTATLTSVTAESIPHLKRGAIRDFKNIMVSHNYWNDELWNATDSIYSFETGSKIEFFSTDNADKLRGGRRDRCFMNEANNNTFDAFEQLEVRTKEYFFLDYNPTTSFWAHEELIDLRDDVDFIILTYLDNEGLSPEIVASIEQRKSRPSWWRVYGEGQLGEVETRIYTGWGVLDEIPPEAKLRRRGGDYGYTNDPTALVDVYSWNGGYILDEQLYKKGMSNKAIADVILSLEDVLNVMDSSEPKSNDELKSYGVQVIGATKGPGSVNQGIQLIQDAQVWVTKRSINLLKEQRNYLWFTDREGKILNTPQDWDNHALDAARYAISSMNPNEPARKAYTFVPDEPIFGSIGL